MSRLVVVRLHELLGRDLLPREKVAARIFGAEHFASMRCDRIFVDAGEPCFVQAATEMLGAARIEVPSVESVTLTSKASWVAECHEWCRDWDNDQSSPNMLREWRPITYLRERQRMAALAADMVRLLPPTGCGLCIGPPLFTELLCLVLSEWVGVGSFPPFSGIEALVAPRTGKSPYSILRILS